MELRAGKFDLFSLFTNYLNFESNERKSSDKSVDKTCMYLKKNIKNASCNV